MLRFAQRLHHGTLTHAKTIHELCSIIPVWSAAALQHNAIDAGFHTEEAVFFITIIIPLYISNVEYTGIKHWQRRHNALH